MDDQAAVLSPHRLRDDLRQERADDQLRRVASDRDFDRRARVDHGHGYVMSELGECDKGPLAQAVVSRNEEEDAQPLPGNRGGSRRAQRALAAPKDLAKLHSISHDDVLRLRGRPPERAWTNALHSSTNWTGVSI
jgi:hypothetical protein